MPVLLLINLAINNAGVAYSVNLGTDELGTINLATGAFTAIGSIGFDANYAQDMEFDRDKNELYMAAYGTTGRTEVDQPGHRKHTRDRTIPGWS
ncbi:MAG: hypothetical protein IPH45_20910 [Bacteroidales bacterium]|nr:hypothetical protein [Bacteroidales bacterium]